MTIEEMRKRKKALGLTSEMIAERSGVPLSTVQKIFAGATANPRLETRLKIAKVLLESEADNYYYSGADRGNSAVREDNLAAKYDAAGSYAGAIEFYSQHDPSDSAGPYLVEDYYRYSGERRAELINGYLYDMAAPTSTHQIIAAQIYRTLMDYAESTDYACRAYMSPVDVKLSDDSRNMVQPDVFMICHNEARDTIRYIDGAPDFVVEVLSPSTASRDFDDKKLQYLRCGVREYWIVDPECRIVDTFDFEKGRIFRRYTFDDVIPVSISGGKLAVDFRMISEVLDRMQRSDRDDQH